jgi:hypothetical protein
MWAWTWKGKSGSLTDTLHKAIDGVGGERTAALGLEHERHLRIPLQLAQRAQFVASDRVNSRLAFLRPTDVESGTATPLYCDHSSSATSTARSPYR